MMHMYAHRNAGLAHMQRHHVILVHTSRTQVLKYFLAQRRLNETFQGGVGSFLLQVMTVASVQVSTDLY